MKLFSRKFIMIVLLAVLCLQQVRAADSTQLKTVNTSILLPLYLDSLFKNASYQFGNGLPKFILPALEFYNGVQLAADSLKQEGISARIEIIDSRKTTAVQNLFTSAVNKPSLIIGVMQSGTELKSVSGAAQVVNVPFISATYPNDGGVSSNPDLLIVNSTLKTHCIAIYRYLQKNYHNSNLVFITRKGPADERIKNDFKEIEKTIDGDKLKFKMTSFTDSFNTFDISVYLDSTKINTIVGGSLDKDFGLKIISNLSSIRTTYASNVFGMPTWDELPLDKPEYKGVDVYYSTPFLSYSGNPAAFASLTKKFKKIANSRPSDMVFKGFEITYRYVKTLYEHPQDFMDHINDSQYKMFTDFKFEPVLSKENEDQTDYWENRKIYFIKKTDGQIKGVY